MEDERDVALINWLADFIASSTYSFDMSQPTAKPHCGTAGCIGGHAAVLWEDIRDNNWGVDSGYSWKDEALAEKLGISWHAHRAMCYPGDDEEESCFSDTGTYINYSKVSRESAVDMLRNFARTGEVVWRQFPDGIPEGFQDE
jgi:hypothetical protein